MATLLLADDFERANTSPSANPGSVGNDWLQIFDASWRILSGSAAHVLGTGFVGPLVRPSSENVLDQLATTVFAADADGGFTPQVVVRYQDENNYYYATANPTFGLQVYRRVAGVVAEILRVSGAVSNGAVYRVSLAASGTSPANT